MLYVILAVWAVLLLFNVVILARFSNRIMDSIDAIERLSDHHYTQLRREILDVYPYLRTRLGNPLSDTCIESRVETLERRLEEISGIVYQRDPNTLGPVINEPKRAT